MGDVRIFAGGGGSAEQEAEVLSGFTKSVAPAGTVVSIPWAKPDPADLATATWVSSTLGAFGIREIRTLTSVEMNPTLLDGADAALLTGGNTFLLLQRLRETGLGAALVRKIERGMPCYGGSAGAIVLGSHIGTAAHLDSNDVGLTDLRGLGLFDGFALWCHFSERDTARVDLYRAAARVPVIGLPENAGLVRDALGVAPIGPGQPLKWQGSIEGEPLPVRAV